MKTGRLGDLCQIQSGGTPRRSERGFYGGAIPWAKIADLQTAEAFIKTTEESLTDQGLAAIRRELFPPGTILLAMYGSVGKVAVAGVALTANQAILGIQVTQPADLSPEYLRRWLEHIQSKLLFDARGVTQQNISATLVRDLKIPLPPLPEQHRIAMILDKADAIRRKRRDSQRLLDEFLRSAFREMFGDPVGNGRSWEVAPLGIIAEVQGGLQVTIARVAYPVEIPYLRVANVYRDRLDLTEIKTLKVTADEARRTNLHAGDLLIVEGHGNRDELGRAAMWDGSIESCVHQNHLIRARLDGSRADPIYASAYLNSAAGRRQMLRSGKTTSGLNTISTGNVRSVDVVLPPLALQKRYHELHDRAKAARERMITAHDAADALFDSLAHHAFRNGLHDDAAT